MDAEQWRLLTTYEALKPRALEILAAESEWLRARVIERKSYGGAGAINGPFVRTAEDREQAIAAHMRDMAIEQARNEVVVKYSGHR